MKQLNAYKIGQSVIREIDDADPRDPLGILWVWEPPSEKETYVVGVDPTQGLTGWTRQYRSADSKETDNAAIEVIRIGREGRSDFQVAEYAAPLDALDLAPVVNAIGRLYRGASEEGMALCIIETTGSGIMTQRELMSRFNYSNVYVWKYLDRLNVMRTPTFGWQASKDNNKQLHNSSNTKPIFDK